MDCSKCLRQTIIPLENHFTAQFMMGGMCTCVLYDINSLIVWKALSWQFFSSAYDTLYLFMCVHTFVCFYSTIYWSCNAIFCMIVYLIIRSHTCVLRAAMYKSLETRKMSSPFYLVLVYLLVFLRIWILWRAIPVLQFSVRKCAQNKTKKK